MTTDHALASRAEEKPMSVEHVLSHSPKAPSSHSLIVTPSTKQHVRKKLDSVDKYKSSKRANGLAYVNRIYSCMFPIVCKSIPINRTTAPNDS